MEELVCFQYKSKFTLLRITKFDFTYSVTNLCKVLYIYIISSLLIFDDKVFATPMSGKNSADYYDLLFSVKAVTNYLYSCTKCF